MEPVTPHPPDDDMGAQGGFDYPPPAVMRPRPLPSEIVFPTNHVLQKHFIKFTYEHFVGYVVGLARGLAFDSWRIDDEKPAAAYSARGFPQISVDASALPAIRESPDLVPIDWSSFPILVDGTEVVIDFGDWSILNARAADHPHWLRFHFHSSYKSYPWLGAFTPPSFLDWADYDYMQSRLRKVRNPRTARAIMNNQNIWNAYDSRQRRRLLVRGMLHTAFGDRVDFRKITPIPPYYPTDPGGTGIIPDFRRLDHALCYVQVPGSWENILDRGQLRMMGWGIPTISPIVYDQCCDGLMQPGIHYLACRQDYMDVVDLIHWCESHRDEAAAISHNAWLFFQEFCTPLAVWSYVKDRIDNGARHWRGNIDDDLCPPGLYAPKPGP